MRTFFLPGEEGVYRGKEGGAMTHGARAGSLEGAARESSTTCAGEPESVGAGAKDQRRRSMRKGSDSIGPGGPSMIVYGRLVTEQAGQGLAWRVNPAEIIL